VSSIGTSIVDPIVAIETPYLVIRTTKTTRCNFGASNIYHISLIDTIQNASFRKTPHISKQQNPKTINLGG
jgi:hypothetical protein